jgi:RNA polymerase sigma factor (sigma-70 family)
MSMAGIRKLSGEYELDLIKRAQNGDQDALIRLLKQYEPLVTQFSAKIKLPGYDHNDCRQEVRKWIVEAVQTFDFDRKATLITYIYKLIGFGYGAEIKSLNRDKRKIVFCQTFSLDSSQSDTSLKTGRSLNPWERITNDDHLEFDAINVKQMLSILNLTEIKVVWCMYDDMSTKEIADTINKTVERVDQIKSNIARKFEIYATENPV